jgi:hypothetical protein
MSAKRPPKAAILIDCKKEKEGRKEGELTGSSGLARTLQTTKPAVDAE